MGVFLRASCVVAALVAATLPAAAQEPPPAPTPELGRKAYTSYCVRCHGINLVVSGGAFFDLRRFPATDKERFMRSVAKGVRAMPAWEGIVKPHEMEAIWAYVGSVNGWPAPAAAAGESRAASTQAQ